MEAVGPLTPCHHGSFHSPPVRRQTNAGPPRGVPKPAVRDVARSRVGKQPRIVAPPSSSEHPARAIGQPVVRPGRDASGRETVRMACSICAKGIIGCLKQQVHAGRERESNAAHMIQWNND